MKLVSRKTWGARPPRGVDRIESTHGVKIHYMGAPVNLALLGDHLLCRGVVRSIQVTHMDERGWNDIAYNALVCPHGEVFEGRGLHALPAANGPGLNHGHYAVCALLGNDGLTEPTPDMLHGLRDAIEWLRRYGHAGREIRGHKDGYSTDCPGRPLYAWVRAGAPRPNDHQEDDVSAADVWNHPIDTGDGKAPWKAGTVLGHLEKEQDAIKASQQAIREDLEKLRTVFSAHLDALTAKLEAALADD